MDFVVEVVLQLVFEVLGESLVEAGFHGAAMVLRSRIGPVVVASVVGFGAGLWWGVRLSERGRTHEPRTLWISLALGVVAAAGAA